MKKSIYIIVLILISTNISCAQHREYKIYDVHNNKSYERDGWDYKAKVLMNNASEPYKKDDLVLAYLQNSYYVLSIAAISGDTISSSKGFFSVNGLPYNYNSGKFIVTFENDMNFKKIKSEYPNITFDSALYVFDIGFSINVDFKTYQELLSNSLIKKIYPFAYNVTDYKYTYSTKIMYEINWDSILSIQSDYIIPIHKDISSNASYNIFESENETTKSSNTKYYFLADVDFNSFSDSRYFGLISENDIIGTVQKMYLFKSKEIFDDNDKGPKRIIRKWDFEE